MYICNTIVGLLLNVWTRECIYMAFLCVGYRMYIIYCAILYYLGNKYKRECMFVAIYTSSVCYYICIT